MDATTEALGLIGRIRARFPSESAKTDEWVIARFGSLEDMPHVWVEAFADRTSDAIRARDARLVMEHTEFLSAQYRHGSEHVRQLVDVAYAENLMWNMDGASKVWAWSHISPTVKDLYEQMWGVPKP
jgi:hypothetical protein